MNCHETKQSLDAYLDDELSEQATSAFEKHVSTCPDCQEYLQQAETLQASLRQLPVPPPANGFFERALTTAVIGQRPSGRFGYRLWAAIAAGVVLFLTAGLIWQSTFRDHDLPAVTMTLQETRDVRLVFYSKTALPNAQLVLEIPKNVVLQGYANRRTLSWRTDIRAGNNILRLPLKAVSVAEEKLIARLGHDGKSKTFVVRITVIGSGTSKRPWPFPVVSYVPGTNPLNA